MCQPGKGQPSAWAGPSWGFQFIPRIGIYIALAAWAATLLATVVGASTTASTTYLHPDHLGGTNSLILRCFGRHCLTVTESAKATTAAEYSD